MYILKNKIRYNCPNMWILNNILDAINPWIFLSFVLRFHWEQLDSNLKQIIFGISTFANLTLTLRENYVKILRWFSRALLNVLITLHTMSDRYEKAQFHQRTVQLYVDFK